MKDFLRVQPMMRTQVNVVLYLVNNLLVLERTLSSLTIGLTCQLYQTLIELVQGPCPANQRLLIGTNLCDVAVRCLHASYPDCDVADVIELKTLCLKLLLAMVEGVRSSFIPRRIASSLDYTKLIHEIDEAYVLSGGDPKAPAPNPSLEDQEMDDDERGYRQLGFYFYLLVCTLSQYEGGRLLERTRLEAASYPVFAAGTANIESARANPPCRAACVSPRTCRLPSPSRSLQSPLRRSRMRSSPV